MPKIGLQSIIPLVLIVALAIGITVIGECFGHQLEARQTPNQIIETIPPEEAFSLIEDNQQNPDFIILDMRTFEDFVTCHIDGAVNIDSQLETLQGVIEVLDRNKTYLVYCGRGSRSIITSDIMAELNFREVYNLLGGIEAWQELGLSVVK